MHHNDSPTVAVNEFVRRQVKGSGKTYSEELTFEEIATHAAKQMQHGFSKTDIAMALFWLLWMKLWWINSAVRLSALRKISN